jgi:hypothetical protein
VGHGWIAHCLRAKRGYKIVMDDSRWKFLPGEVEDNWFLIHLFNIPRRLDLMSGLHKTPI